jgi:hypothetical protein
MTFDKTQWPVYLAWLGAVLACGALAYRLRQAERQQQTSTQALTQRLTATEVRLQHAIEQTAEQARRLALLELHLHQNRVGSGLSSNANGDNIASMTERRHRVMVLARRGMDTEMIAETLGVPKGEIELIISLSSLKAAA